MTDEPYRWLEAVANRREYIQDQLKTATPVFAFSRPEGILFYGVGSGQSKIFEVYDRHALGALGNPVDIEKVRQTLIESAHVEGFARASEDVTLRRLINFSLGPLLKTSFEQIFGAPLMVISLLAEIGLSPAHDVLARVNYDGNHQVYAGDFAVAHPDSTLGNEITAELSRDLSPTLPLAEVIARARQTWLKFNSAEISRLAESTAHAPVIRLEEIGLLDRRATGRARYRALETQPLP